MKNKKQFILDYVGTKYTETDKIKNIDLDKIKYIVEPFGGSFGFSRYCYYNLKLKDKKYIIYDINKELIDFYKRIQKLVIENKIEDLMKEYNKIIDYCFDELKDEKSVLKRKRKCINLKKYKKFILTIKDENLFFMLNQPINKQFGSHYKKNCDFEIFKHCKFINEDFSNEDLNKFNKDFFFYLDPPYNKSCNAYYSKKINLNKIFDKIYEIIYTKRKKCIFIHSNNWFIDKVYNKKKVYEYEKMYFMKKNKLIHCCYGNCKFNTS